jgi:hypothetical protein
MGAHTEIHIRVAHSALYPIGYSALYPIGYSALYPIGYTAHTEIHIMIHYSALYRNSAWHALVSGLLVMIHYEMTTDVLFLMTLFPWLSPYILSRDSYL